MLFLRLVDRWFQIDSSTFIKKLIITDHGKLFYGRGLRKNVGHHGWPTTKNFKITLVENEI